MKLHRIFILLCLIVIGTQVQSQPLQVTFYNRTGYTITNIIILKKPAGTLNKGASVVLEFDSLDLCGGIPCEMQEISGKIGGTLLKNPVIGYMYGPETIEKATPGDHLQFDIVLETTFKEKNFRFSKHPIQKPKPAASKGTPKK